MTEEFKPCPFCNGAAAYWEGVLCIDCGGSCENIWWESDTNASGCRKSENGDYCPNDVAETLRDVAKVARAALEGEGK